MSWNGKTVFCKYFVVFYEHMESNFMVSTNWILGWKIIAVENEHSKQLANMTLKLETSERTTIDGKLKRRVVKLAPLFYESVFREKNRTGNVGASHRLVKKVDLEHAGREKKLKLLKT